MEVVPAAAQAAVEEVAGDAIPTKKCLWLNRNIESKGCQVR